MLTAICCAFAASVFAQGTGAAITGILKDAQGGVLPGVTLNVRNVDTGTLRNTVSDADGRYRVAGLQPGRYELRAELPGFATVEVKDITLTIGLEYQRDFTLTVESLQESVTVTGETPIVETTQTKVGATVTQQQIDLLPVEGRAAPTLSLLLPGTSTDNVRAKRPNANVGSGGMGVNATNYLVDGMSNMISRAGDARDNIPQAAIQEFNVILSQPPAEYGGRSGGVVSVQTKSGTNRFGGEAFEYFRHKDLNRMDEFQQALHDTAGTPKPNYRRDQNGVAFGGPIIKDRLHFFFTEEHTDEKTYFTVATGKPQFYGSQEGTFLGGYGATGYFGRADWQINTQQNFFFRYFKQHSTTFSDGCGGTKSSFSCGDTGVPGWTYLGSHTWVVSPKVLNELTGMYAQSYNSSVLTPKAPSQYNTGNLFTDGSQVYNFPSFSWGFKPGTQFKSIYRWVRDTMSVSSGTHTFKFGGGAAILPTIMSGSQNAGTWTFGTDQFFNPGDPNFKFSQLTNATQFTATFPRVPFNNLSHTYEAFAQDEWKPLRGLTLNLGARYDIQTQIWNENFTMDRYPRVLPYVVFKGRGDHNNVAPRLGFAWDVRHDAKSVVRGGYGVIYTNIQNGWFDGEETALLQSSVTIRNPSYPDPYQGRDPFSFVSTAPPNITVAANNNVNPPARTMSGGFSQQVAQNTSINVDAVFTKTTDFPVAIQVNEPDPVTKAVPLPAWGHIAQITPAGTFNYKALLVRFDKRFSHRTQYTFSYTLGKQDNNYSGGAGGTSGGTRTDNLHPEYDQGPANNDRRQNFVASGAVLLPKDVNLGVVWTLRSSLPFSALAGRDLNNDGANTDYVPGTTRDQGNRGLNMALVNAWRASNALAPIAGSIDSTRYNRFDVRVAKQIPVGAGRRVELIGQLFNVFGVDNLGGIGTTYVTNSLSDSFGKVLTALPRQQAELAVRFVF
jgi:hypothetical protein